MTLGVSGMLWRDALIMFDRETRSLWSQVLGRAVAGPLEGERLDEIPSEMTTWGEWRRRHPHTLVLARPANIRGSAYDRYFQDPDMIGVRGTRNPDRRLPGKAMVVGMELEDGSVALPLEELEQTPVFNGEALGLPIVAFSPPGDTAVHVFGRQVGERRLRFTGEMVDGELRVTDGATGSSWHWQTGRCLDGPCPARSLERVQVRPVYWGIWAQYHPGSAIAGQDDDGGDG